MALVTLGAGIAWAQDTPPADPPAATEPAPALDAALAEPTATLNTFIDAMGRFTIRGEADAFARAQACCDLSAVASEGQRRELVANLYFVLRRLGFVDAYFTPSADPGYDAGTWQYFPHPTDPENGHKRRIARKNPGMKVSLARDAGGSWRFSAATMAAVPDMRRGVEDETPVMSGRDVAVTLGQRVRAMIPEKLRTGTLLGVEYWQWLAILIAVLAGLVLDMLVRTFLAFAWRRNRAKHKKESDREVVRRAVRPFGLFAAGVLWFALLQIGGLPVAVSNALLVAVKVIIGASGVWAMFRVTDLLAHVARERAARTRTRIDDLLIPLVERTLKVFFFAMGLIYIADSFSVEILPLLTGLGIGGLAIAFAAKDTIENFFGSVAVIMDRPFEVGDYIKIEGVAGTVEQMGLRSTRIRTFENTLVTMPNASLVRVTVDNYGKRRYRRFKTMINVTYATTPDKIEAFCEGIRELIRVHPMTRKDWYHVWLHEFGAHSLDILLVVFFEVPDWPEEYRERHRLMLDIIRLADRLGVEFAFPTQTLHVFKEEHGVEHAPADAPGTDPESPAHAAAHDAVRVLTGERAALGARPGKVEFGRAKTKG